MTEIDRKQLKRMMDEDTAIVVEVLGKDQYDEFHLPGAINIPLGDDFDRKIQRTIPDKRQPVALYCKDENCDASPRAARRMEELGYQRVYDYTAGKIDWKEAGLPVET